MPVSKSISNIYSEEISSPEHGLALWDPDPGYDGTNKRRPRVRPGDVGYVTEQGTFRRLFNLHLPIDHPEQAPRRKLPQNFVHIELYLEWDVERRAYQPESIRARVKRGLKASVDVSGCVDYTWIILLSDFSTAHTI